MATTPTTTETILADPAVHQVITDAKAAGVQALTDARAGIHVLLGHVATNLGNEIPLIEQAVTDVAMDFVPSQMRPFVAPLFQAAAAPAERQFTTTVQAGITKALGIALARIDAALGTTGT
ncbi:MAG: hypothetical protein JWM87_799 [Candidatus Eremiobacteraeota bacterium]|nr:hypothetical protein [Candidatus Eremiobacteraeota bacterium]